MVKKERYIQQESRKYIHRSELGLLPGTRFLSADVKLTKPPGFGLFNVAGYWRRKYRGKVEDEGWYLLTNLTNSQEAIAAFKCRSGIEALHTCDMLSANNQRKFSYDLS